MSDPDDNDHWIIGCAESDALEKTAWERWIHTVEDLLGHSADGNQATDGYSMDHFYDAWREGITPSQAVLRASGGPCGCTTGLSVSAPDLRGSRT